MERLFQGEALPLPLDTTMTIVVHSHSTATTRDGDAGASDGSASNSASASPAPPEVTVISPVPLDEALRERLQALGEVTRIVVPSLQHWLFAADWADAYPEARLLAAPAAMGQDLRHKLPMHLLPRLELLEDGSALFNGHLDARLLRGAPQDMNEFVFFHPASKTLIASDAFYGGMGGDCGARQRGYFWALNKITQCHVKQAMRRRSRLPSCLAAAPWSHRGLRVSGSS